MTRRWLAMGIVLALIAVSLVAGQLLHPARVDGKTARVWLAQAMQAAHDVAYEAKGIVHDGAVTATFTEQRSRRQTLLTYTDTAHAGAYMHLENGMVEVRACDGTIIRQPVAANAAATMPAHYALCFGGVTRVAGRPAVVVLVRDHLGGDLLARYALDRETAVPLQTITYYPHSRASRETTYTQITYRRHACTGGHPRQHPATPPAATASLTLAQVEKKAGFHWLTPGWLPDGFTAAAYRAGACPCGCGGQTIQVTYHDGLRSFMVAEKVESTDSPAATHGCMDSGMSEGKCDMQANGGCGAACSMNGTPVVTRKLADRTVIVVGDIAPDTLQRVAESITP